jgi:hypothetical protein
MKHNATKGLISLVIICFAFIVLLWIDNSLVPQWTPADSGIPEEEILYCPDRSGTAGKMEFISSEGTRSITRAALIPANVLGGLAPIYGLVENCTNAAWGLDGESIGEILPVWGFNGQGYPLIIEQNGKIKYCGEKKSIIARNRILALNESTLMAISISEQENHGVLVLYNMNTCQITQEIYIPDAGMSLEEFSYSKTAPLALELHSEQGTEINLIRFDGEQVMTIPGASDPSWSKDGQKLAYKNERGGLCVLDFANNGTFCLLSIKLVGPISWSPDGKRVVYENENGEIEVLNLETREKTQIGQGNWPDWRP